LAELAPEMRETIPNIFLHQTNFSMFGLNIILLLPNTIVFLPNVCEFTTDAVLVLRNVGLLIPDNILLVCDAG
jgi:hypothetical protein